VFSWRFSSVRYEDVSPSTSTSTTSVVFSLLRQTMQHFKQILHQQWHIYLQTYHQISVKSLNVCNSYNKFSEVPENIKCLLLATFKCKSRIYLKSVFKTLHVLKICKLEDVNVTAWLLRRSSSYWLSGWNVPRLRSNATSAGRHRHSCCGTHAVPVSPLR